MSEHHLSVLGGGHMGRALIGGLLRSGTRPERLSVGEAAEAARLALGRDFGVSATADNARAVDGASVVVLAVKPQEAQAVVGGVAPLLRAQRPLLLSIVAGVRVSTLEGWCGAGVPVARAMPNRPALLGAGATALYARAALGSELRAAAERVARAVGEIVWVPEEELLEVVTALSGSGPAYFFLLAELMAEAAAGLGLAAPVARRLAAATLYGSGLMAAAGDADLGRLRAEVTSKGGTTAAALEVFASADLKGIVERALAAAARRGRELGQEAQGNN
jgi:pyrroline-5-carboxylate reductase